MENFNIWEDAKLNNRLWRKDGMKSLLRKHKGVIDEEALSFGEDILFKMTKSQYDEALSEYREEARNKVLRQTRVEADMKPLRENREREAHGHAATKKEQAAEDGIAKLKQREAEQLAEAEQRRKAAAANPPVMKRDNSLGAKVAEKIAKSSAAHAAAVAAQGVSESFANPAGLARRTYNFAKGNGFNTGLERVEPKNNFERGLEAATGAAYSAVLGSLAGGVAATTKTVTTAAKSTNKFVRGGAKAFQYVALPGAEGAQIGAAAGGAALPVMADIKEPDKNASAYEKAKVAAANFGLSVLGSAAVGGMGGAAHHVLNRNTINRGIKNFKTGLKTQNYKDVKLGEFSRRALAELNEIRYQEGVSLMRNNNLMIPAGVVKHIYEKRVTGDGLGAKDVVQILKKAFYTKNATVSKGRYSHIQEVRSKGNNIGNVGYIAINPANKKNVVKTVLAKENKRLK